MHLPKIRYAVFVGALLGLIVPVAFLTYVFAFHGLASLWALFLWPSSIMLMATENMGHSAEAFGILALSIFINVVLGALVLSLIWCLGWVIRAWRLSLRDGTTI